MREIIKQYIPFVKFLGSLLGKHYEIVLYELKEKGSGIIAIENSHISRRKVGDGLTDLLLKFIKEETYRKNEFQTNYTCISNGRKLRGSTYFIMEGDILVGLLCINFDLETFVELDIKLLQFANIAQETISDSLANSAGISGNNIETILSSVTELCEKEIEEYTKKCNLHIGQFTQEDKLKIIDSLNQKGVFLIKGIVPDVARLIGSSDVSIYRYLGKLNKKKI